MPDFEHFRVSYLTMNPAVGGGHTDPPSPEQGYFLGDHSQGLDLGASHLSGLAYLHLGGPPAASALRNDLGSNISVLKTLNLRFRCFLAKVHELERRNKALEKQLQQALEESGPGGPRGPLTKDMGVQTGFIGPVPVGPGLRDADTTAFLQGGLLSPTLHPPPLCDDNSPPLRSRPPHIATDSNSNQLTTSPSGRSRSNINDRYLPPPPRFLPGSIWSFSHTRRFGSGRESCVSWTPPDGVGVQIDTITPEIRALYNVLGKVRRERDEFRSRSVTGRVCCHRNTPEADCRGVVLCVDIVYVNRSFHR